MLEEEHLLGAGREAGDRLCQFILGTVYKVTNWTCAGGTKGFSQDHTDYYLANERPKKLWLKPLAKNPCALLLTQWLQANTGILPRSLAFDGKSIGDGKCGMII